MLGNFTIAMQVQSRNGQPRGHKGTASKVVPLGQVCVRDCLHDEVQRVPFVFPASIDTRPAPPTTPGAWEATTSAKITNDQTTTLVAAAIWTMQKNDLDEVGDNE